MTGAASGVGGAVTPIRGGASGADGSGGTAGGASAGAGVETRRFRIGTEGPAEAPGGGGELGPGAPAWNSSVKLPPDGAGADRSVGGTCFATLDASSFGLDPSSFAGGVDSGA